MAHDSLIEINVTSKVNNERYDGLIIISNSIEELKSEEQLKPFASPINQYAKINRSVETGKAVVLAYPNIPSQRLIYSSTGVIDEDFDDSRIYIEAGKAGMKAALDAGVKSPLLAVVPSPRFKNAFLCAALGVLHEIYVPLIVRRSSKPEQSRKIDFMGLLDLEASNCDQLIRFVDSLQSSFNVCRDIGEADPQTMAPPKMAEYVMEQFKESSVKVTVEDDQAEIAQKYPLLAAVNRSANDVKEHQARVIWLEYENKEGEGKDFETLMLVGKGVTLDTGGTDLKIGGAMFGMCRDKYGAAVVAGFFDVLDKLRPQNIKVVGVLCAVRNSIGSNAFTCDEIIRSRSGKSILVGNTDAEGRLAMLDPLCMMRERAVKELNPHLYTLATLTGHALLSYGDYATICDNGPANRTGHAALLQEIGDLYGQPLEISRLYKEDFKFNVSPTPAADLRQATNRASIQTPRGHQIPAAFLIQGSGLDNHGNAAKTPIKYSHIDMGSCMGTYPEITFPNPLLALTAFYVFPRA